MEEKGEMTMKYWIATKKIHRDRAVGSSSTVSVLNGLLYDTSDDAHAKVIEDIESMGGNIERNYDDGCTVVVYSHTDGCEIEYVISEVEDDFTKTLESKVDKAIEMIDAEFPGHNPSMGYDHEDSRCRSVHVYDVTEEEYPKIHRRIWDILHDLSEDTKYFISPSLHDIEDTRKYYSEHHNKELDKTENKDAEAR